MSYSTYKRQKHLCDWNTMALTSNEKFLNVTNYSYFVTEPKGVDIGDQIGQPVYNRNVNENYDREMNGTVGNTETEPETLNNNPQIIVTPNKF